MLIKKTTLDVEDLAFKAGDVVLITDPCYIVRDDLWGDVCNHLDFNGSVISVGGVNLPFMSTTYGDGSYEVTQNGKVVGHFGVDAGLFTIVRLSDMKDNPGFEDRYRIGLKERNDLGAIVTISKKSKIEYSNGDMTLGDLTVITSE